MSVAASSDLHKAINTTWEASTLNASFQDLWDSGESSFNPALHDGEASPGQPFPYCVFEQSPGETQSRMTGHDSSEKHEIRDIPISFRIHARVLSDDNRSAKEIAADMAELVMQVFGGHPTVSPDELTLENGSFLIAQYQTDYGVRSDDDVYTWIINYIFRLDVPMAV